MITKTHTCTLTGSKATLVTAEVALTKGNFGFTILGQPRRAVRECWVRIFTALKICGYGDLNKKTVVNLTPAELPKFGAGFDLPVALGILAAHGRIEKEKLNDYLIVGELSLGGEIRPVNGVLSMAIEARKMGFRGMIIPQSNLSEVSGIQNWEIISVTHFREAIGFMKGTLKVKENHLKIKNPPAPEVRKSSKLDFSDVKGQSTVKRALEIAAAGGHSCLLSGPPGSGKTMLAQRLPAILPPMTEEEAFETQKIYSVAGIPCRDISLAASRPFRSPHHTVTEKALIGGGIPQRPGEISLAHNGVLFLDELTEFPSSMLETLRQPLEDRAVTLSGGKTATQFQSNFLLIAACNPCPCGYLNHPDRQCSCSPVQVRRYLSKISGPLLDRIDMHIKVSPVPFEVIASKKRVEKSATIRKRVIKVRKIQQRRFMKDPGIYANANMSTRMIRELCPIDKEGAMLLKVAMKKLNLSARAFDRIIKVSRTIADLAGTDGILPEHLAEAIQYRSLGRESWGG